MFRILIRPLVLSTGLAGLASFWAPATQAQDAPKDRPAAIQIAPSAEKAMFRPFYNERLRLFTPLPEVRREKGFRTGKLEWRLKERRAPVWTPPTPDVFRVEPAISLSFDLRWNDVRPVK
jgi:hypothetical protein